jgi:hypothetical protein
LATLAKALGHPARIAIIISSKWTVVYAEIL